jgi:very-short-patch-repair endonuclease
VNGPLEEEFLLLCEREGIALPEVNARVGGYRVDAVGPRERLVVELDGKAAHSSAARRMIDHDRDLKLRELGFVVRRYSGAQVFGRPQAVAEDLRMAIAAQALSDRDSERNARAAVRRG